MPKYNNKAANICQYFFKKFFHKIEPGGIKSPSSLHNGTITFNVLFICTLSAFDFYCRYYGQLTFIIANRDVIARIIGHNLAV